MSNKNKEYMLFYVAMVGCAVYKPVGGCLEYNSDRIIPTEMSKMIPELCPDYTKNSAFENCQTLSRGIYRIHGNRHACKYMQ